ncbi:MAG: hypothetical protein WC838_01320 [Candidatus Margulisiibacteriota bacterium]|jgi:hypothetical protein
MLEEVWGSNEYQLVKEALLEKPGQAAQVFMAMGGQLDRFLSESDPARYLQQVELLSGIVRSIRRDPVLDVIAKTKVQKLLEKISEHANDLLRKMPLDEQKVQLQRLAPETLALILMQAPVEVKKMFEEEALTGDLMESISEKDLGKLELLLKGEAKADELQLAKILKEAYEESPMTSDAVAEDTEFLLLVESFTHILAGSQKYKISNEEMRKVWKIIKLTTIMATRVGSDDPEARIWRHKTMEILNRIASVLGEYPLEQAAKTVENLPKGAQHYVLSKLPKEAKVKQPDVMIRKSKVIMPMDLPRKGERTVI